MRLTTTLLTLTACCLFLFLGLACEDSGPRVQDGTVSDGDADSDSDGDADSDSDGDADDESILSFDVAVCVQSCSSANDCTPTGADEIHDADNYSCVDGNCVYTGCNSDAECDQAYPAMAYICHETGCLPQCSTAADCSLDFADADEDNFICDNGACVNTGCNNDDECEEAYGSIYSCQDPMGSGVPVCRLMCEDDSVDVCIPTQDDAAYDADNYSCLLDECYYTGCNSDDECGSGYRCLNL